MKNADCCNDCFKNGECYLQSGNIVFKCEFYIKPSNWQDKYKEEAICDVVPWGKPLKKKKDKI